MKKASAPLTQPQKLAGSLLFPGFYIATMALAWSLLPQARTFVPFVIATVVFWAIATVSERPLLGRQQA